MTASSIITPRNYNLAAPGPRPPSGPQVKKFIEWATRDRPFWLVWHGSSETVAKRMATFSENESQDGRPKGPTVNRPGRKAGNGFTSRNERRRCGTIAVPGLRPSSSSVAQTTPLRAWLFTARAFGPGEAHPSCSFCEIPKFQGSMGLNQFSDTALLKFCNSLIRTVPRSSISSQLLTSGVSSGLDR